MVRTIVACTIALFVFAASVAAQHGGGAKPHGSQAPKPTAHGGGHATKPSGGSPKPHATGGSHGSPKTTTHSTKTPKSMTPKTKTTTVSATKPAKTEKTGKTTTASTTTTATGSTTTLTPVQLKLQKNTQLAAKLQTRLPPGTDLQLAAAGFRNLGQFVAAVNVSNNLGIAFTELKTRMLDQGMSLGQAIQDAPRLTTTTSTTSTSVIVARAEAEADDLIRTTESTKTKPKPKKTRTTGGQK